MSQREVLFYCRQQEEIKRAGEKMVKRMNEAGYDDLLGTYYVIDEAAFAPDQKRESNSDSGVQGAEENHKC